MKTTNNTSTRHCEEERQSNPLSPNTNGLPHSAPLRSQGQTYQRRLSSGFTLVELIVVITILVILGTIAFINLGGFAGSARDSARISNLNSLKTGLDLVQIKSGSYPMPEGKVDITASGVTIGYQGYAGEQTASLAKLSPGATKDPSDATIFMTYSVNLAQTKMQAMSFLEDSSTVTAFYSPTQGLGVDTANAFTTSDYSKRYPKVIGDGLGILLENNTGTTNNRPIQENTSIYASGTLDIITSTGGLYKAYISSTNTLSGTGTAVFIPLLTNYDNSVGTFPGCDTKNIKLPNGQIWSACNLGATIAFNGSNAGTYSANGSTTRGGNDTVNGLLFQWGRNKGFASTDITKQAQLTSNPNTNDTFNFVWSGALVNGDWLNPQIDTLWGGSVTDSATVDGQTDKTQRKGPCPVGYHVPSAKDFQDACNTINGSFCTAGIANTTVRTILALPYAGYRYWSTGLYDNQGTVGYYWSSSPSSPNGFYLYFNAASIWSTDNIGNRAFGFPVRCLKD